MKRSKILCLALGAVLAVSGFAGCKNNDNGGGLNIKQPTEEDTNYKYVEYEAEHSAQNNFVNFVSSDTSLDDFINEFAERHMRGTEKRVGTASVGGSTRPPWREWDSMISAWWDASAENGTMNANYANNDFVNKWLKSPLQDKQGYVWTDNSSSTSLDDWALGWAFPNSKEHFGKYWDFRDSKDSGGWTADSDKYTVSYNKTSYMTVSTKSAQNTIEVETSSFNSLTCRTPLLRLGFALNISGTVDDVKIYYQTNEEKTWTSDKSASFKDFCINAVDLNGNDIKTSRNYFLPMYLQSKWGAFYKKDGTKYNRQITSLRIVVTAPAGKTISGSLDVDFVSSQYDDRQIINPCNYIIAAKNMLEYSRDAQLLSTVLPKARAAMNFLLNQGKGSTGLVSTEYFPGHFNEGFHETGTGIGNGYWDVDAFPTVNLYCNLSYYNALVAMDWLERTAKAMDVADYEKSVSTLNSAMNGVDRYNMETVAKLPGLIELCKSRIRTEFWNETAGRFHVGEYDRVGGVQDHGYTLFNQQAIAAGLATEEQTEKILSWINGEREADWTDNSTGKDIYYYEIAPRFNTEDIGGDFTFAYSCDWNNNVQNGGTALHLSYYDIVAQAKTGATSAFGKLKNLQAWYEKVKAAGGEGTNFYRKYYSQIHIPLQGNNGTGEDSGGLVGLDSEFLEAALMFRAVPEAFFGLSAKSDGTLDFVPRMPADLDWWRIENLVFDGYYYDATVSKFFFELSGVREYKKGSGNERAHVAVTFDKPKFEFAVKIDGVKTSAYVEHDDKIIITVPLTDTKVEIVEA